MRWGWNPPAFWTMRGWWSGSASGSAWNRNSPSPATIQQALLPQGLHDFPHLAVTGMHYPCHEVGGDYFDVFPAGPERTAFLIADVSGKGLGAALLTTMLQGALSAMALGTDPVRVFNHINKFLCEHGEVGRYATMFFGVA